MRTLVRRLGKALCGFVRQGIAQQTADDTSEITANMLKIINFKTEYRSKPLGIDNKKPRFSWQFSENAEIESYRISVYGDE